MLNTIVVVRLKLRLKGKCPNHPRYNPELGQGAIRGGCQYCQALYAVTQARDQLHAAAARLEELALPYTVERARKTNPGIQEGEAA